jgi:hypothetical protein
MAHDRLMIELVLMVEFLKVVRVERTPELPQQESAKTWKEWFQMKKSGRYSDGTTESNRTVRLSRLASRSGVWSSIDRVNTGFHAVCH